MKRFTRLLSIFLAVLMLSGVLTTAASALSFTFDSDNSGTTSNPVKLGSGATGTDEPSAVVRVYVKGTGTKGYSVGSVLGCSNLTVGAGYVIVNTGINVNGIEPINGASPDEIPADTIKKIKESITLPKVPDAVTEVNKRRGPEGLTEWVATDYSDVIVDSIMWEKSDKAYHVHLTLVGNLVITANSYTYDGQPHSWTYTGLNEGHTVKNIPSYVDAGTYTLNTDTIKIFDASGKDVTNQYKISVSGTLTITQRPLTITTGTKSWPYDGKLHSYDSYTPSGLATGDWISSITFPSIKEEGSIPNEPSNVVVMSARGDTTKNYAITYVNGTLTITGKQYTPNPEYVDSSITIYKVDPSNYALSGAKFTLYNGDHDIYTGTTGSDGKLTISTRDISEYLPTSDTFTLRETQAPSGYTASDKYWNVTVSVSESERYNNNGTFTKIYTYTMKVNNSSELTVVNSKTQTPTPKPDTTSFTLYKQDSSTYKALKGATFYLYDEYYNTHYTSERVASATSDSYGRVTFSGLAEGTYYLVEYSAPSGYTKDSTVYRIDVRVPSGSIDKKLVAFITAENAISKRSIAEANGYVIYNDRQQQVVTDTTSFTIVKRDSAWPYDTLSGAWFDLYDSSYVLRSGKYDTKAKPIDSQKTDKYGEATFSKLAAGTYYLVEYSAPSGYTKDSTVYRITVRYPSGNSKLTAFITKDNASDNRSLTEANGYIIYNTKTAASYGTVTVSKEVSGIGTSSKTKYSFEIWEKNGKKALKSFTLTAGSSTTISLDPGSYIIKELDASKVGYELKTYIDGSLSRTGQTSFTVKAGGKTSIAFKNVYAASIDLNTEDHYAYIIGYEDGTVRPNGNLTRAEVATIFFRMLTDDARSKYWCTTNNYTDVSSDDWFNNAVSTLSYAGIINGYSDGSFQPKGTITRAELVKMAMGFFNYTTGSSSSRFTDVGDHWAASYINKAAELGYLDIFGSTFEPNKAITRAEAITIINRVLGRSPHKDYMNIRQTYWSDNPTSAWYYADIQEATNSHDYTWINIYGNQYEEWTSALENRDWAALEKKWSTTYSSHNPGNVW